MTNEEYIKSLGKWELAEFIYHVSNNATHITVCTDECKKCDYSESFCIYQIAEWLMNERKNNGMVNR